MTHIKVGSNEINVDIRAELENFEWAGARWSTNKLIATSPFRYDKSPSFYVNLEGEYAGVWGDSGAFDEEWRSGNFVKLLSFLRNETYEETVEYLDEIYGDGQPSDRTTLVLPSFNMRPTYRSLSEDKIEVVASPYLSMRGIDPIVQQIAGVGRTYYKYFVALPWHSPDGRIANIKYRSTRGKTFFYEKDATPIGRLVYGVHLYTKSTDDLVICEAEIDALSWREVGINAVAVGGVAFSDVQHDIIKRLPAKRIILAGDNDQIGQAFNDRLAKKIRGRDVYKATLPKEYKDANDVLTQGKRLILLASAHYAEKVEIF